MSYNPLIHHRKSIRLKGYDYSKAGLYFITICCHNGKHRFGKIIQGEMILNELGQIAYNEWKQLAERFTSFELDVFQIMPNHIHGIIVLNNPAGATLAVAPNTPNTPNTPNETPQNEMDGNNIGQLHVGQPRGLSPTVGDVVGAYKSLVVNACLDIYKTKNEIMGKFWQRNYYEIIIRNRQSYQNISNYIINNPLKWKGDKFFAK